MGKPVVYDLFCGLGGWSKGFIAEGYRAVGFDIERHEYGDKRYPGELILHDVLSLHGRQLRDASTLVASPPCQKYSYMAMPWSRAKAQAAAIRADTTGRALEELNALFNACFRIQREASEAAGRPIPLVVENVQGAQPWVGPAKANFGSYYLWGDVESVGGAIVMGYSSPKFGELLRAQKLRKRPGLNFHAFENGLGSSPAFHAASHENRAVKVIAHANIRDGHAHTRHLTNQAEHGIKQAGLSGPAWFNEGAAAGSSSSQTRKEASARIAEIPFTLASWIARSLLNTPVKSGGLAQV